VLTQKSWFLSYSVERVPSKDRRPDNIDLAVDGPTALLVEAESEGCAAQRNANGGLATRISVSGSSWMSLQLTSTPREGCDPIKDLLDVASRSVE
jgi:hypothetical protein